MDELAKGRTREEVMEDMSTKVMAGGI